MEIIDIVYFLVTLAGLATAFFTNRKYNAAKDNILEVIGHVADLMAVSHKVLTAISKGESCDPATLRQVATKIEEVWQHIGDLGPSFQAILASKTSHAKGLENVGGK